ncbi:MAG: hypothetical protein IKM66_04985 [Clostridia bacterium]|nr:hypothetical protein [Clostridia bacterium]
MSTEENKSTKKASSYSKSSSDSKIVGLLVGILAVGVCLLGVSVAGMVNISKAPVAETTTQAPIQNDQVIQNDVPVINNQPETTTASQNTDTPVTPDNNSTPSNTSAPQTDAEWLTFFNTALNKLKTDGPALTKEKQVVTTDVKLSNPLGQTVVSVAKDKFLSEEVVVTPIAKGDKAAAAANISPDGKSYVSTLGMSDIKSITHTTDSNGNYVITIAMPEMTSPDISGPYGRIFVFLTVDEVMNSYAPDMGATVDRSNVSLLFSNCSATATISPDGKVVAYETTLNINMILKDAKIAVITTDVDAKLLSETKYKDIVW